MADVFRSTAALCDALADATFDRPPALVSNAHITGLGVARALTRADVSVIALDRNGQGVAPPSNAVDYAGAVTYPLDDEAGFREDVQRVVEAAGTEAVAFPCMDEWVHAYVRTEPDGVVCPFADKAGIDRVLDKTSLYDAAADLGVPHPETYQLSEVNPETAADRLGFPLVVKPALKREFEEAVGTNVVEVSDREELAEVVATAADHDVEIMAQKRVDVAAGRDHSLASYVPPSGTADALSVVGNARVRHPRAYGTSCLVEQSENPAIRERALSVLSEALYHGISEAEFVYDTEREEFLLLDINTRSWKWIGMPVAAGVNLPVAAYASTTDEQYDAEPVSQARWVYLRDYVARLATDDEFRDRLAPQDWTAIAADRAATRDLTTGVFSRADPAPTAKLLETEFSDREYYCSC